MATFGTRAASKFKLPSVESEETYYTLIDSDTGKITLKRINKLVPDSPIAGLSEGQDATVGTIENGKFSPGAGATPTEKSAFAKQPQRTTEVINQAKITTQKAKINLGETQKAAEAQTNQLLSPNTSNGGTDLTDASNPLFGTGQIVGGDSGVKGANLKYPTDMLANQDHIVFEALEYQARALGAEAEGGGAFALQKRDSTRSSSGSVRLPIQGQIADSNAVNWGQDEMDPVALMAAKTFLEGAKNGFGAAGEVVGDATDAIAQNPEAAKTGAVASLLSQAIGKPNILSRTTGAIVNPNMELLFQGPSLRPFTFTFRMSARDKPEGDEIRKIIFFFKKAMAARQTKNGFFLKAPNTFRITYKCDGKDHVGINKIKECALLNCAVSYVPDGQYASRADGNLTAYEMQLQFQELEPVYYDDYEGLDNTVGY